MTMRITGMNSGLDTEAIISELVKAKRVKVDKLNKNKTKAEWKQDAWKDLNKDLKSLQSKFSNLRYSSAYKKKSSVSSNPSAVRIIAGAGAMNSVQSLSIKKLAQSAYLTGQEVTTKTGEAAKGSTLLSELDLKDANGNTIAAFEGEGSFTVTTGGKQKTIEINSATTIDNLVSKLNSAGVSANFDAKNGRIFIGASGSGTANDFTITADNAGGLNAMSVLGINVDPNAATTAEYKKYSDYYGALHGQDKDAAIEAITSDTTSEIYKMLKAELTDPENPDFDEAYDKLIAKIEYAHEYANSNNTALYSTGAKKLDAADAEIELNGVTFTSSSNNIEVNGLTFECKAVADNITVTTSDDTDGIYDMVKDLLKDYNEIINKLDKLYNAESAAKFEPLTDEEKDAMTDTEIEKWETKIKDSILRRDDSLALVFNGLKESMAGGITINGKTLYLSDFGISTPGYFEAEDNEKNAYHIYGDADDAYSSGKEDKLKSMISSDPDTVISFFSQLSAKVYDKMSDLSASSTYSSFGSFYNDKQMKTDLSDFSTKILQAEEKLADYEDKFYAKFSKMETALAKLNSQTSYITGLFGGGN